ncbi:MAG TPA: saccharopine dehydrogenase C-terminal domain-containing protein, partial [Cyclobacteriaceae bacterium]|nr:saccharopine dehydrogenase C-terminal domain-containing protein [Cyclobacteriaceae bacterium]
MSNISILVAGAGRSSFSLIDYLLKVCRKKNWKLYVGDISLEAAKTKINNQPGAEAITFDIADEANALANILKVNLVISLLPANLHAPLARLCLKSKKHLLTASYVSPEMQSLHEDAANSDIIFLNECGFDPGIDHMSAMQVIDNIKAEGGELISFESFAGGLIAPETEKDNPWKYKFTWSPRNVVMAGQGTARYIHGGKVKYISYPQLFQRITNVQVPGYGAYEGYANRDSTLYRELYGLQNIQTLLRGTLRKAGFCSAWNVFVQLGMTDDTWRMKNLEQITHADFMQSFLAHSDELSVEEKIARALQLNEEGEEIKRLRWSGLFDDTPVGLSEGSPAEVLQHILNKKWAMQSGETDMVVMLHRF